MNHLTSRIFYKILRKFKSGLFFKIKGGPIKNFLWSVCVEDSRYILGEYEAQLASLVVCETQKGKRFIDIGSNAGYFSMIASRYSLVGTRNLSIEPIPKNIEIQNKHLELNKIKNVEILPIAISDKNGFVEFCDSGNLSANTYKKESTGYVGGRITISTSSLDEIAIKYGLDENCFIKIDVEGAELDVLIGGKNYLRKYQPNIMLATHDCHVPGVNDSCLKLISEYGYNYKKIEDDKTVIGQVDYFVFK